MAQVALAECIVEEDRLPPTCQVSFEPERQGEISLTPQGNLQRVQCIQFSRGGQSEVYPWHPIQGFCEVLDHRASSE